MEGRRGKAREPARGATHARRGKAGTKRFLCLLRCVLLRNSKSIKAAPVLVFCLE
ncbi:hypothetical protein V6Z11_D01G112400 [Gossypium hirsutum]